MRKLTPDEARRIELEILLEFDRICAAHGLTYFLAYGTALGAMRHAGFIPWDDDIDVMMPRKDYERLYEIFRTGERGVLKLVSYRDRSSVYHFFKLTDARTQAYETYVRTEYATGLWIDIFALEPACPGPSFEKTRRTCSKWLFVKSLCVGRPEVATSPAAGLAKRVLCPLARPLDPFALAARVDRLAAGMTPPGGSATGWACIDDFASAVSSYGDDLLFPTRRVPFEGHLLPVPHRVEEYLDQTYEDWRALPPEDERRPHFSEAWLLG